MERSLCLERHPSSSEGKIKRRKDCRACESFSRCDSSGKRWALGCLGKEEGEKQQNSSTLKAKKNHPAMRERERRQERALAATQSNGKQISFAAAFPQETVEVEVLPRKAP